MRSDLLFRIGGCAGSFAAVSENRPVYDPGAPDLQRRAAFRRELYGGRTTSYFLRYKDTYIIVDQGSGVEPIAEYIGDMLRAEGVTEKVIHCLQTHYHEDHVSGVHANSLIFNKNLTLRFYSPELSAHRKEVGKIDVPMMQEVLAKCFREFEWPVTLETLHAIGAKHEHVEFQLGDVLELDDIKVHTTFLNHPGGCSGFRFEFPGEPIIVVATDYEPAEEPDARVVDFMEGASLLLSDIQYRESEYLGEQPIGRMAAPRIGWGHGTPERTLSTILKCQKRPGIVRIVHHEPKRDDMELRLFYEESANVLNTLNEGDAFDYEFAHDGDVFWL